MIPDHFEPPSIGQFDINYEKRGIARYTFNNGTNKYVSMTGSAVNTLFTLPKGARLLRIELSLTDNTNTRDNAGATYLIQRQNYQGVTGLTLDLYASAASALISSVVFSAGGQDEWYFNAPADFNISVNAANNDRLRITVYIQYADWENIIIVDNVNQISQLPPASV